MAGKPTATAGSKFFDILEKRTLSVEGFNSLPGTYFSLHAMKHAAIVKTARALQSIETEEALFHLLKTHRVKFDLLIINPPYHAIQFFCSEMIDSKYIA